MNNPEPPEELVNKKFDFVGIHFDSEVDLNHPKTLSMPYSNGSWVPSKQTFIEDLDIVFWVFLDNADEDRVHHKVLFNVSARINPGEFLGDPAPAKNGSHKLNGLYQAMFNIDINPKGLDESAITWAASAPQSVNQEITQTESVTDSFSFDIGYKVAKVSRSWTYQFGRSYAVKQWNLVETGMGKKMGWKFWQKLPWDGLTGGENIDHTQVPDLSRYSTQFFAQGLWKTTRQIKGIVDFEVIIQHQPQGIFTLPKIAMPTQETIRQTHTLAVDFSKVK